MRSLLTMAVYPTSEPYPFQVVVPDSARPDAGRGLAFRGWWLVSTPQARHIRWLAPWLQLVIAEAWNAAVVISRWLWRANRRDPRYALTSVAGAVLWFSLIHLDPLTLWPVGWAAGVVLGFIWIIRPLWEGGS